MIDNSEWPSREAIASVKNSIRFLVAIIVAGLVVAALCWMTRLLLVGDDESSDPPIIHGASQ